MSMEGGGKRDLSSSVFQLDAGLNYDDDEDDEGHMVSSPPESRGGYAFSPAPTSCPSQSSALTPSYSNRSRLVACEYEEICSDRWLPRSPSSSVAAEERDEGINSPDMPSLSERYSQSYSTYRSFRPDYSGVQSTDRLNDSEREQTGNEEAVSVYLSKKSEKGKKSGGVIARIYMRFWGKRNKRANEEYIDNYLDHEMGSRRFTYKELANATNNFSPDLRLGEGGFGVVYRGFLKDMKMDVAIKKISKSSRQGLKEYRSEIRVLGQLRHKNLVSFIGWCHEQQVLLLVYEFMPNGSLDSHLYATRIGLFLDWKTRYTIVLGLASALLYLHEGWMTCIIHRDIKPSNVLLDSAFNAKLTDFGLARILFPDDDNSVITTNVAGTWGYLAPEYVMTGVLSKESDIYSFGVVVLEIVCGRKSIMRGTDIEVERNLVEWVWTLHGTGRVLRAADRRLRLDGQFDMKEMECLLLVGLWCCHPDKGSRPNARQVIGVLNFETQIPTLPLTMPVPVYPSRIPLQSNSFSGSSISKTLSNITTGSVKSLESSADHTQIIDNHSQTSIETEDKHLQTSTSKKSNTTLAIRIPAGTEGKCEYPVGCSTLTNRLSHDESQRPGAIVESAQETFDIGIPINYTSTGPLQSYQLPLIKGLIASLHEILKSDPGFAEVKESIRKFTSMLSMVGAPLDDWNSLAQDVLRSVKQIDNLKLKTEVDEDDPSARILSFLLDEIDHCKQSSEEDAAMLVNSHQQLHHAIQDHVSLTTRYIELQKLLISLQKQIKDAEDTCFSVLKEVNVIETRRDWNETRLESLRAAAASATQNLELEKEQRKQTIMASSESMFSKLSSFTFDG